MIPARTVVYRHACHCANANVVPDDPDHDEHRFDVDGEPFPWYITEDGATFRQLCPNLYVVGVTVMVIGRFTHHDTEQPQLDGVAFPWALHGPVTYTTDGTGISRLELGFLAEHVDTDGTTA